MLKFSSEIKVYTASDECALYKKLDIDTAEFIEYSANIVPEKDNRYVADDENCHGFKVANEISKIAFDGEVIQTGWCFGGGVKMNGMEWHESPEVVVACTDAVLLLGSYDDIINEVYDSKNAIAVSLKKGDAVMLNPRTLHLAPLAVYEFFKVAIVLPKDTNLPLPDGIKGTHRAINKWLLLHSENKNGIAQGGQIGVVGDNITLIK